MLTALNYNSAIKVISTVDVCVDLKGNVALICQTARRQQKKMNNLKCYFIFYNSMHRNDY